MSSGRSFIPYGRQVLTENDRLIVSQVLESDWITTGPKVQEFEQAVSSYCGARHGVAVTSGTAALDIAIQALNLPPQSEIITTPLTFIATINAILFNGHVPVLADITSDTYNIDPASVRQKITSKTKAILYVNYAGQPCDIAGLRAIADEYNLFLIEDSAQALGAEWNKQRIGGFADMTILSFHPVKHITTGEGGMVLTNSDLFHRTLRLLRNHGVDKEVHERLGPQAGWRFDITHLARNYRITDFQCALGTSQLQKMESFLQKRERIAQRYTLELADIPVITLPFVKETVRHAWHLYPILLHDLDRDLFFTKMRERGIGVNVHHIPPYEFTYHQRFGWRPADVPIADSVFRRTITLPIHVALTDEEQEYIIQSVKEAIEELQQEQKTGTK